MDKRLLFILLIFFGLTKAYSAEKTSAKTPHYHFHFSNTPQRSTFSASNPIVEEQLVFDIQDNDLKLKNGADKLVQCSTNIYAPRSFAVVERRSFPKQIVSNKNEFNLVLRI
jgi:hypothetical protein